MRDLIFVSLEPWDEVWRRNQFVCAELARRFPGNSILFVAPPASLPLLMRAVLFSRSNTGRRDLRHMLRTRFRSLPEPGIHVYTPLKWFPNPLPGARKWNETRMARGIRLAAKKAGVSDPILWLNPHDAGFLIGQLGERGAVYDITDDWELAVPSGPQRERIAQEDRMLCRQVDLTVVCSQALFDSRQSVARRLLLLANGVNAQHYARQGPDPRPPGRFSQNGTFFPANPAQPNPAQPNPAQPNPAQPNPAQSSSAQSNPAQSNPAQPNPAQPNPAQSSSAQSSSAQNQKPVSSENARGTSTQTTLTSQTPTAVQETTPTRTSTTSPRTPTNRLGETSWPRPVFGYTGSLHAERIDLELVEQLAREFPHGSVVLVGPQHWNDDSLARALQKHSNLFAPGSVAYAQIPDVMARFDVCIVPHKRSEFVESLNPIKLWEFLACGKPIVSTDVAGFRDFPVLVRLAKNAPAFLEACRAALQEVNACDEPLAPTPPNPDSATGPNPDNRIPPNPDNGSPVSFPSRQNEGDQGRCFEVERQKVAREHSWSGRVDELLRAWQAAGLISQDDKTAPAQFASLAREETR